MFGKYKHSVDEKGRLFVPSKLREELGSTFYVTLGLDHCLSVYTEAGWKAIVDKYNALPIVQARKMRFLFANAAGHAEIWDSAAYDELEQQTLTPENLAAVMEELGF